MHPNPIFRQVPQAESLAFALARGFGILTANGPARPVLAHVPFVAAGDGVIEAHLVRSNPLARMLAEPCEAVLAVSGPDAYVSPDWYGLADQVPTWNYVAVHLHGTLSLAPADSLRDHLDRLSGRFETPLLPKPVWRTDKMPGELMERMMRQIVPVRLEVTAIDGTWKLGQNKAAAARRGAADAILATAAATGQGHEAAALAALMQRAAGAPDEPPAAAAAAHGMAEEERR